MVDFVVFPFKIPQFGKNWFLNYVPTKNTSNNVKAGKPKIIFPSKFVHFVKKVWSSTTLFFLRKAKTLMYKKCDVTSEAEIEAAFNFANQELALPDKPVEVLINR